MQAKRRRGYGRITWKFWCGSITWDQALQYHVESRAAELPGIY